MTESAPAHFGHDETGPVTDLNHIISCGILKTPLLVGGMALGARARSRAVRAACRAAVLLGASAAAVLAMAGAAFAIRTDDGTFSVAVSEVTWTGGKILPGQYQDFSVSADPVVASGNSTPLEWFDPITENPKVNTTGDWEVWNFAAGGHDFHVHLAEFQLQGQPVRLALPLPRSRGQRHDAPVALRVLTQTAA